MKTVFILSGPAGVGKTTVWESIKNLCYEDIERIITTTTRLKRENERDRIDFYFISQEAFENQIESGEMIEYAIVHKNYYGSTYRELDRVLESGKCPIYIIEPHGMIHIKPILEKQGHRVVTIFLLPPSQEVWIDRLQKRGTENHEEYETRLISARYEMRQKDLYDYQIINDALEVTKHEVMNTFKEYLS